MLLRQTRLGNGRITTRICQATKQFSPLVTAIARRRQAEAALRRRLVRPFDGVGVAFRSPQQFFGHEHVPNSDLFDRFRIFARKAGLALLADSAHLFASLRYRPALLPTGSCILPPNHEQQRIDCADKCLSTDRSPTRPLKPSRPKALRDP